ncbi:MAG: asparagine synthase (glutamine-hydrolyzing) [Gemmatimonadetes bacterium]|nr:asparagine synthase (glutamine-hydrolyzing) [Gemmatimonadota bacterium]
MCGIYGMVSLTERPLERPDLLACMGASLHHRGPDHSGVLRSTHAAIGAERLSIIDRRPQANQPFTDSSQNAWFVCNGEIYNASALRKRFSQYRFRSCCDVETLVPLFEADGVSGLDEVDGMFALAVWHEPTRSLTLARDRAGEKPLFYTHGGGELWFASEIQALLHHPALGRRLNQSALNEYLTFGYVREPHTLFQNICKVPAGTSITFECAGRARTRHISVPKMAAPATPADASALLRDLFVHAVEKQLAADVPVGVFTSGGIDSAFITAIANRSSARPIHTFTASFANSRYDEGKHARRLSRDLKTRHVEIRIDEPLLKEAFHTVFSRMAEPLADPALLPTYLLSRAARDHVGVVLTGEGADELFGGYPTYPGHRAADAYATLPPFLRRTTERVLSTIPSTNSPVPLSLMIQRFTKYAGRPWLERHIGWFGTGLFSYLPEHAQTGVCDALPTISCADPAVAAMRFDYLTYLRDGLLVKLDRAGMMVSLESRAPFLDPHVTALARSFPPSYFQRRSRGKGVLKRAAAPLVPGWVVRRRKRGLSVPVAAWINDGLRGEVNRLLDPKRIRPEGVLSTIPIDQLLCDHRAGRANHARALWPLIVLQYWLEHWVPDGVS